MRSTDETEAEAEAPPKAVRKKARGPARTKPHLNDEVSRLCKKILRSDEKLTFETIDEDLLCRTLLAIISDARWPSVRYKALYMMMARKFKITKQPGSGRRAPGEEAPAEPEDERDEDGDGEGDFELDELL